MDLPLVSVVIPAKDRAHFLRETIDSVLSQDYPAIECVVVDAASTDGTRQVLESYGERISWVSEPDHGPFDAIEKGWQHSRGDILAWLNADDVWLPGAVTAAVSAFRRSASAAVVYGSCAGLDDRGELVWWEPARPWTLEAAIVDADHVINQPAAFIRRSWVDAAGGLAREWVHDHDLWIRIGLAGGEFCGVTQTLAAVRIHPGNHSMRAQFAHELKLALVRGWLEDERVPANIRRQRRKAVSNAHLRGLHYLKPGRPGDWLLGARWMGAAFVSSPANTPEIAMRAVRLARMKARRRRELRAISRTLPLPRQRGGAGRA